MTPHRREDPVSPRQIIAAGLCIGCGACVSRAADGDATMTWDSYGQLKPTGTFAWLRERAVAFSKTCPFSPLSANEDELAAALFPNAKQRDPQIGLFQSAYVGHAAEADFRAAGSSGGMVTWVAAELLRRCLVDGVAHVAPAEGDQRRFFQYQISRSVEAVRAGAKSRYYPVELSSVLQQIRSTPGRYAIVGIPCFIKAIHLACKEEPLLRERIAFTLGLYCGHMKSARFVESFAWQMGADMRAVNGVEYRLKDPGRPANWYRARLTLKDGTSREQDWWHLVDGDWGSGFFQNSACDFCDDVIAETADISFGDAWVEPWSSDGRGTNVVVVRSAVLHDLLIEAIDAGRVDLRPVDSDFVVRTQEAGFRQRREGLAFRLHRFPPSLKPRKRVEAGGQSLAARRVFIYVMRRKISIWSHRVFAAARWLRAPALYMRWARATLTLYRGLAYSAGWLGWCIDRLSFTRGA